MFKFNCLSLPRLRQECRFFLCGGEKYVHPLYPITIWLSRHSIEKSSLSVLAEMGYETQKGAHQLLCPAPLFSRSSPGITALKHIKIHTTQEQSSPTSLLCALVFCIIVYFAVSPFPVQTL